MFPFLSFYGCSLWSLSSSSLRIIEVSLNELLRKLCNLPHNSHLAIAHCVAQIDSISSFVFSRFLSLLSSSSSKPSLLVKLPFQFYHKLSIHLLDVITSMVPDISLIIHSQILVLPVRLGLSDASVADNFFNKTLFITCPASRFFFIHVCLHLHLYLVC